MKEIRKIVRNCIQESFWTEKDWDTYLGKGVSKNDKLKDDIKEYIESENFRLKGSVFIIMDLAKKSNPEQSEYDLISTVESYLLSLKHEDDHMDNTFRDRFSKVYEEFDYMFEKINEVVSAASDSTTDNQLKDPGVSAVSTSSTDDEDINENKKDNKKSKRKPFVMTLPSGLLYSFTY
jgi:DNA polymerase III alpha subunit (gram-positive type)